MDHVFNHQPDLPVSRAAWKIRCIDFQIVSKYNSWNLNKTQRLAAIDEAKNTGATHISIAIPYDNPSKWFDWVTDIRSRGLLIFFRSHWNAWEGDNGASANLTKEDYLSKTEQFIKDYPSFFKPGDLFGLAVESSNADSKGNTTFKTDGVFDIQKYKKFEIDQVRIANKSFAAIGLERQIHTWCISTNVSLLDLNGVVWNNTSGNSAGLNYRDILKYFAGRLCIDHYQSNTITTGSAYYTAIKADLQNFKKSFPGCVLLQGEIGYATNSTPTDSEQLDVYNGFVPALLEEDVVIGVNFWVNMASTNSSLWTDSGGTIVAGGRPAVSVIKTAFTQIGIKHQIQTPTGTVNGINKVFTVTMKPLYVVADQKTYFEGAGYSILNLTITMDTAPSNSIRVVI